MTLGLILVGLGTMFLLNTLGIISDMTWDLVWPVLLIAWGLSIIYHRLRYGRRHRWSGW